MFKNNNDVKASDNANGPKNAKEILEESVKFYKGQDIKSLNIEAAGEIKVKNDSKYTLGVNVVCDHIFKDKIFELEKGKIVATTTFNNKSYSVTLHCFEDGSMGYALNQGKVYDVSDISGMLGIKKTIPACSNIITEESAMPEFSTDLYEEGAEETFVPTLEPYEIEDVLELADKLALKGYKNVDGKEVYVLKGIHSNNAIINSINEMIESNIYNLPTQFGDLGYDIYVDSESFEIIGMDIDLGNVVKTLSQSSQEVDNIIKVKFELNKPTQLPEVEVRKAGLDNISQIWTFMQYYTNVMNGLKQ